MSQSSPTVIDLLEKEHSQELAHVEQLQDELKSAKKKCRKMSDALKILRGSESGLTKDHVRPLVKQLLQDNPTLSSDAIYALVQEKLAEQKIPAKGLGLRVREILAEDWITEVENGVFSMLSSQSA